MKNEKMWWWRRDKKREELLDMENKIHKMLINNSEHNPKTEDLYSKIKTNIPPAKRINTVITRLKWFSKTIHGFSLRGYINSGDGPTIGGYVTIPWLFSLSIECQCDYDWFKNRYPKLFEENGKIAWGISLSKDYIYISWNDYEDCMCDSNKRTGFHYIAEWSDIIRGNYTKVIWDEPVKVLTTTRKIATGYKTENYPDAKKMIASDKVIVTLPITVYKKVGTWYYKRWFNKKYTRYEVVCDVGIVVPGKGENSWDCDDEIHKSPWNEKEKSSSFSTGGCKSPELAADTYVNSIEHCLNR